MNWAFTKRREFQLLMLMSVLVSVGEWISTRFSTDAAGATCVWIQNGIATAFILTAPKRWKPAFFTAAAVMSMMTDAALGDPFVANCCYEVCNCAEILIGVLCIGHLASRSEVTNLRAICRIANFGVILGPLAGALLGTPVVVALQGRPWMEVLRLWFLSESLGVAGCLSVGLLLLTSGKRRTGSRRARYLEMAAWSSPLVAFTVAVFWQTRYPIVFLVIPPLVAVIFRYRLSGAVFGSALVVVIAAGFTGEGHGPFKLHPGDPVGQVMPFHIFGLTLYGTCISVGLSIETWARFGRALKEANRKLKDQTQMDALTGVRNRRSFDEFMQSEWSTANGAELSVLYLDIDYFKRFNDAYGHQLGDDCLRRVAGALTGSVRNNIDCVARYGGEEFVIALPGASAESARITAERVVGAVRALNIPHRDSPSGAVSVSVGVATLRPQSGDAPSTLVRAADQALYEAKGSGRDRIVTCLPDSERELVLRECAT